MLINLFNIVQGFPKYLTKLSDNLIFLNNFNNFNNFI